MFARAELEKVLGTSAQRKLDGKGELEIRAQRGAGEFEESLGRRAEARGAVRLIPVLDLFSGKGDGRESGHEILVDEIAEETQGQAVRLEGLDPEERNCSGSEAEVGEELGRERQELGLLGSNEPRESGAGRRGSIVHTNGRGSVGM